MKKTLVTCLFLISTLIVSAQNYSKDLNIDEIYSSYMEILKLEKKEAKKFKKILISYYEKLNSIENINDKSMYNKVLKNMDLEVYSISTQIQFDAYKKLKLQLEPNKKYRWE